MANRHRLAPQLAVATAVGLGVLSVCSLVATIRAVGAGAVVEDVRRGRSVGAQPLARAARASRDAAWWFAPGHYYTEAAIAAIAAPDVGGAGQLRDLPSGESLLLAALREAPASPHNWTRLAIEQSRAGRGAAACQAWAASVLASRIPPGLVHARLRVGYRILPCSDRDMVFLLADQTRLAAGIDLGRLTALAREEHAAPFVRVSLSGTPPALAAFERELAALNASARK